MAEIKLTELPVITESDFTKNDRFVIIDDGSVRQMTRETFESWLRANVQGEKGEQGVAGRDGTNGRDGRDGRDGSDGLSAYQIAVSNGYTGNISQWLSSLKGSSGAKGADGGDGWSPVLKLAQRGSDSVLHLVDWVGGTGVKPVEVGYVSETGIVSNIANATKVNGERGERGLQGNKGDRGLQGVQGERGLQGIQGDDAYQVAVSLGFTGTQEEWLLSLKGAKGDKGEKGDKGDRGETGLISGSQVTIDPTTKIIHDGSTIPTNSPSKRVVGTLDENLATVAYVKGQVGVVSVNLNDKAEIDDTVTNEVNAWSSQKVSSYVDEEILALINGAEEDSDTLKELSDKIVALAQADSGLISATESQSFEEGEKEVARTNIGVYSKEEVDLSLADKADTTSLGNASSKTVVVDPVTNVVYEGDVVPENLASSKLVGLEPDNVPTVQFVNDSILAISPETVVDQNTGLSLKFWTGTQEEYDLVAEKDPNTIYVVK